MGTPVAFQGMAREATPILIGYDGSAVSRDAVRHAGELFAGRPAVVATVWEPALAHVAATPAGLLTAPMLPNPGAIEAIDLSEGEHASTVAAHGVELARSFGLVAEPKSVLDKVDVAETLIALAGEREAAVVVVGSHGISGLRTSLLGSVSRQVIEHCDRPVLVIREKKA